VLEHFACPGEVIHKSGETHTPRSQGPEGSATTSCEFLVGLPALLTNACPYEVADESA
jgi:hypothetical protein